MTVQVVTKDRPIRQQVSEAEWDARVELAAAYRLTAMHGWTYLAASHISARVPDEENTFLINAHGLFFEEITASNLIKVDFDGRQLTESDYRANPAGYTIHAGILAGRPDLASVMHTHTTAGMALSALSCGLLSIDQESMRYHNRIGYHAFEGIAHDLGEGERLIRDLGPHFAMILRNHGLLTCGRSVGEAFQRMFYLERSAETQLAAMAAGAPLHEVPDEVCEHTARQFEKMGAAHATRDWTALKRQLDRADRSYRD
jgi:ribulose-5-phosphate 4-epimerase/fuculose-1-phosphate aldolase